MPRRPRKRCRCFIFTAIRRTIRRSTSFTSRRSRRVRSLHDWIIRAHRHRNLFQILVIRQGGGEMNYEASTLPFEAPCAILVPATVAHGYRFQPAARPKAGSSASPRTRRTALGQFVRTRRCRACVRLAAEPVVPLRRGRSRAHRCSLCESLNEERFLAREGFRLAMRGYLALIAIEIARLAASRARTGAMTLRARDPTSRGAARSAGAEFPQAAIARLLCREACDDARPAQRSRQARDRRHRGHLIRQRVLTEAKRQLVFTTEPIHEIAYDLGFSDPSHFARFFRKQTGTTPQDFRAHGGG